VVAGHSGQFIYPRRLPVNTVIHTTFLAGFEPTTFRLLVRRATSSATYSTVVQDQVCSCSFIQRRLKTDWITLHFYPRHATVFAVERRLSVCLSVLHNRYYTTTALIIFKIVAPFNSHKVLQNSDGDLEHRWDVYQRFEQLQSCSPCSTKV